METKKKLLFDNFVQDKGVDRFTKVQEYEQYDSIKLNGETLSELSKSLSGELEFGDDELGKIQQGLARIRGPKFSINLDFIYRKKLEIDIIMVKLGVSQISMSGDQYNQGLLKDGSMFLLFDESETIKLENGDYHAGTNEDLYFQSDINLLLKAVNAKKIEYRCLGKRGVFSEGSLSDEDMLKIKGFYAALFDPEFDNVYDLVLKKAEEEEAEKKRNEENERLKKEIQKEKAAKLAAAKKAKLERLEQIRKEMIELDVNGLLNKELLNGDLNNLVSKIKSDEYNVFKDDTFTGSVILVGFASAAGVWWYVSFWKAVVVAVVTVYLAAQFSKQYKKKLKAKLNADPDLFRLVSELITDFGKTEKSVSKTTNSVKPEQSSEPFECAVTLLQVGAPKLEVVKVLKEFLNISLSEAKDLTENTPRTIQVGISKDKALEFVEKLEELGSEVEIQFLN